MTVTEKLIRAKEDYDAVYESGKQSEYDKFWDEYQQNGERTNYMYAFAGTGWTNENFAPKYNIVPDGNASGMFQQTGFSGDLAEFLSNLGVTMDLSKATSLSNLFGSAYGVTRVGVIDVTCSSSTSNLFANAKTLATIDSLVVNISTDLSTAFTNCSSLENIKIDGVIGKSLKFVRSPLSEESVRSIINALSSGVAGQTLTMMASVTLPFYQDEWDDLINSKPNWTISLV